jgi:phosphatidylinositol alpha-1,6-mannosyltransferase
MGDLKVLMVTPDYPPATGGIQILMGRLAASMTKVDVRVLTLNEADADAFDLESGVDVIRHGRESGDRRRRILGLNARTLTAAASYRPDVILAGHAISSLGAISLRRLLGIPLVTYVHADELRMRGGFVPAALRRADSIVAVSRYTRDMVIARGVDPDRVKVIHPGVDLPVAVEREPDERPTLLTIAMLHFRYKGHDVLLRAMPLIRSRIPDVRWVVVGDGGFRATLESGVRSYGLEGTVVVRGRVSDDERDAWLRRASLFCLPSRIPADGFGGEGFGIAYMEAAAHGMATIGGNVAGARDAVIDGETGLLVDPEDRLDLAAAVTELLGDRERAATMGAAGRRYAEAHSYPLIAAGLEAHLRRVVAEA